ncbi:hypothetical protein WA158_003843 [Blastocystis sp. Blastoise]
MSDNQVITEDNIPNKHELQHSWTIYEQVQFSDKKDTNQAYFDSYENICTFKTAELFWLNWTKLPTVSEMFYEGVEKEIVRIDLTGDNSVEKRYKILGQSIFKDNILPQYEDVNNKDGGHVQVTFKNDAHKLLGSFWEYVVLSMIGETLEDGNEITGARILDKSNPEKKFVSYRLEVWFRDYSNQTIKDTLKNRLQLICQKLKIHQDDIKIKDHNMDFSRK